MEARQKQAAVAAVLFLFLAAGPAALSRPNLSSSAGQAGTQAGAQTGTICVHYLGHASFMFEFDNGVTLLADYGRSRSYGLDSPIYGIGDFRPDILLYTHTHHEDHAGGLAPKNIPTVIKGPDMLQFKGIRLRPVPTYEQSLETFDNYSYIISYKGINILFFGDPQALIANVAKPEVRSSVQADYAGTFDLLLLPIGHIEDIVPAAAEFLALFQAQRVVPMHYWSPQERVNFLSILRGKVETERKPYVFEAPGGPRLCLDPPRGGIDSIRVISLEPAVYAPRRRP
jgi:L-ascorbate metabolism protein UlaG (beta-lactamase superfamily)